MSFAYSIQRILEILGSNTVREGDYSGIVTGIASLKAAETGELSFLSNIKYRNQVEHSKASVLLLPENYKGKPAAGQLHIKLENPSFALALICREIEKSLFPNPSPGIHPTAHIEKGAEVAESASIGPFCHLASGVTIKENVILESHVSVGRSTVIGADTRVFPRVVIGDHCQIGPYNRLLAGCVIGSDGYGYEFVEGAHQRVPQIGNVITGAFVDIGANSTVDRARFGTTCIGEGSKIDNQVQIGHNVQIGKHCLLVAQVGVSGSTELGQGVIVGGQAGISGHLKVGDGVRVAGRAGVLRSLEPGASAGGFPAVNLHTFQRLSVLHQRLPEFLKRIEQLEENAEAGQSSVFPNESS